MVIIYALIKLKIMTLKEKLAEYLFSFRWEEDTLPELEESIYNDRTSVVAAESLGITDKLLDEDSERYFLTDKFIYDAF